MENLVEIRDLRVEATTDAGRRIEIIKGVQRVADEHNLAVVVSESQGKQTPRRGWIESVLARRPSGVKP